MAFKMKGIEWGSGEKFVVKESDINGKGVFASKDFKKGELVGIAVTDEEAVKPSPVFRDARTELGKYLNHQNKENAALKSENNTLNIYTKSPIKKGEEITVNYQKGPNYIDGDLKGFKEK